MNKTACACKCASLPALSMHCIQTVNDGGASSCPANVMSGIYIKTLVCKSWWTRWVSLLLSGDALTIPPISITQRIHHVPFCNKSSSIAVDPSDWQEWKKPTYCCRWVGSSWHEYCHLSWASSTQLTNINAHFISSISLILRKRKSSTAKSCVFLMTQSSC